MNEFCKNVQRILKAFSECDDGFRKEFTFNVDKDGIIEASIKFHFGESTPLEMRVSGYSEVFGGQRNEYLRSEVDDFSGEVELLIDTNCGLSVKQILEASYKYCRNQFDNTTFLIKLRKLNFTASKEAGK